MIYEFKRDRRGILYSDDTSNLPNRLLRIDKRDYKNDNSQSEFYSLRITSDYIIKRPVASLNRKERNAYIDMLVSLSQKQNEITSTEFPIGYYREKRKLSGLIIRYYQKGLSLDQIIKERNLSLLRKYYSHSEDNVHNLFMLLDDYLDCLFELYKNDIYYIDVNSNNIVIDNNQVRIIDFDPTRVMVTYINAVMREAIFSGYVDLVADVLYNYNLINESLDAKLTLSHFATDGYNEAKSLIRELERDIR